MSRRPANRYVWISEPSERIHYHERAWLAKQMGVNDCMLDSWSVPNISIVEERTGTNDSPELKSPRLRPSQRYTELLTPWKGGTVWAGSKLFRGMRERILSTEKNPGSHADGRSQTMPMVSRPSTLCLTEQKFGMWTSLEWADL